MNVESIHDRFLHQPNEDDSMKWTPRAYIFSLNWGLIDDFNLLQTNLSSKHKICSLDPSTFWRQTSQTFSLFHNVFFLSATFLFNFTSPKSWSFHDIVHSLDYVSGSWRTAGRVHRSGTWWRSSGNLGWRWLRHLERKPENKHKKGLVYSRSLLYTVYKKEEQRSHMLNIGECHWVCSVINLTGIQVNSKEDVSVNC